MTKDNIVIFLGALIVIALLGTQFGLFSIVADDYLTYHDFRISTASINLNEGNEAAPGCTYDGVQKTCTDSLAITKTTTGGKVSVEGGSLRILSRPNTGPSASYQTTESFKDKDFQITLRIQNTGGNDPRAIIEGVGEIPFGTSTGSEVSRVHTITGEKSAVDEKHFITVDGVNLGKTDFDKIKITALEGIVLVDKIGFRYEFNCVVDSDEVVIADTFLAGSNIDIKKLTYKPTKFCKESYPAVVRSFTELGVQADTRGEIIDILASGNSLTVAEDQTITIHYIADFIEGQTQRCGLDSAFSTILNRCVKIIEEEADPIDVTPTLDPINVGPQETLFTDTITYGDVTLNSASTEFICASEVGNSASSPSPRGDCWKTTLNGNVLFHGQRADINQYLYVTYFTDSDWNKDIGVNTRSNSFVVGVKNFDFFKTHAVSQIFEVKLNNPEVVRFQIENKLSNFKAQDSGVKVTVLKDLVQTENVQLFPLSLNTGLNDYSIPMDTSVLGLTSYEIIPYFKIGDKFIFDDQQLGYTFEVVEVVPTTPTNITTNGTTIIGGTTVSPTSTGVSPTSSPSSPTSTGVSTSVQIPSQVPTEGLSSNTIALLIIMLIIGIGVFVTTQNKK